MLLNIDPSSERFLLDLDRIQRSIGRSTATISSGLRVTVASDAPDEISDILQLYADLQRNSQTRGNLERANSETRTAGDTLATVIVIVDRARVLASQGAGTTVTGGARRILGVEAQALLEQLVNASRVMSGDRFLFSGDLDQAPAYQLNLASPTGVDRLATAAATRLVQHPSGTTFPVAWTAGQIFDPRNPDDSLAAGNAFAAVNGLRLALENDDQAGIDAAMTALRAAGDHMNQALSFYGTVENKVVEAIDSCGSLDVQLKTELSDRRDADLTAAILELERSRTHEQAALGARARMPQGSLFDFLR